jgi:hypothetical protein
MRRDGMRRSESKSASLTEAASISHVTVIEPCQRATTHERHHTETPTGWLPGNSKPETGNPKTLNYEPQATKLGVSVSNPQPSDRKKPSVGTSRRRFRTSSRGGHPTLSPRSRTSPRDRRCLREHVESHR